MICIYEMIVGKPLFDGNHIVEKIKQCHIDISKNIFNEAQSFLLFMLQKEGEKRLSVNELLKHKLITNNIKDFSYNNNIIIIIGIIKIIIIIILIILIKIIISKIIIIIIIIRIIFKIIIKIIKINNYIQKY